MATPTARARLVPIRQSDRRAGIHTNARRQIVVRPVGQQFMRIQSDHCALQHLAGFDETFSPGAQVTGIERFNLTGVQIIGRPPPGASGRSTLGFSEENFVSEAPLVQAQVPDVLQIPVTEEIFLIGINFKEDPLDLFQAVLPGSTDADFTLDPFVTIDVAPVFVSDPASEGLTVLEGSTVVKLTISVLAAHPTGGAGEAGPEAFLHWRVTRP